MYIRCLFEHYSTRSSGPSQPKNQVQETMNISAQRSTTIDFTELATAIMQGHELDAEQALELVSIPDTEVTPLSVPPATFAAGTSAIPSRSTI